MNVPEDYNDDEERDCTAQELLPKNNTNDTDLSVIQTMAPQTTVMTGEHCRSVSGNDNSQSVLGNDRSWSRSIVGAAGHRKQERDKKTRSVRWHKGVSHVQNIAVE